MTPHSWRKRAPLSVQKRLVHALRSALVFSRGRSRRLRKEHLFRSVGIKAELKGKGKCDGVDIKVVLSVISVDTVVYYSSNIRNVKRRFF